MHPSPVGLQRLGPGCLGIPPGHLAHFEAGRPPAHRPASHNCSHLVKINKPVHEGIIPHGRTRQSGNPAPRPRDEGASRFYFSPTSSGLSAHSRSQKLPTAVPASDLRSQDVGGRGVGQVRGGDFEHQLADRVGSDGEVVDDGAQRGKLGVGRRIGERRGGADVAEGLADHGTHPGRVEGLEAAVGERGEAAGVSSATLLLRPETAIRARWDRP